MTEILSSAQMRAIEQAAIESGTVSGLALMERAGAGVVTTILRHWPKKKQRALVLCGPGNNGGDGYVIARLLAELGWAVEVWAPQPPGTPDAQINAKAWAALGGVIDGRPPEMTADTLVIDALFGTGLTRAVAAKFLAPLIHAQAIGARIVAVDILSGLCADSGKVMMEGSGLCRPIDMTVSFQTLKPGHVLFPGGAMTDDLEIVDIGLGDRVARLSAETQTICNAVCAPAAEALCKAQGHKFSHGHAVVLAGGVGRGGAARLAARAALRIGAGLVTLVCPPYALIENAARLDAVMLRAVPDAEALREVLDDTRITACCIGPNLGLDAHASALVKAVLERRCPTVLDADALTLIANDNRLRALVHLDCVLTPHAGEFARLWPELERSKSPKTDEARYAARKIGATVLYKGPDTVIATPEGRVAINSSLRSRSAPWLATAGAGDVLAGLIVGLLARGFVAYEAAQTGAWLHISCALDFGPGLIAEDLPDALPSVFRKLGV